MGARLQVTEETDASQGRLSCQRGREKRLSVERIDAFAAATRPERLPPNTRQILKRSIRDSLSCANIMAHQPDQPSLGWVHTIQ